MKTNPLRKVRRSNMKNKDEGMDFIWWGIILMFILLFVL